MRIWERSHYTLLSVDSDSPLFRLLPIWRLMRTNPRSLSASAIWRSLRFARRVTGENSVRSSNTARENPSERESNLRDRSIRLVDNEVLSQFTYQQREQSYESRAVSA